jgi:hypothetical protein
MYVSLRHLHRCRHGAKFKSSKLVLPHLSGTIVFKKRFRSKHSMLFRPTMHDDLSSTQRCVFHYLHRCRHGAKFKSSNGFCPTLYIYKTLKFLVLQGAPYIYTYTHISRLRVNIINNV